MKDRLYIFQKTKMVEFLKYLYGMTRDVHADGSAQLDEVKKAILSGDYTKIIVDPYIVCKKRDPKALVELLRHATDNGINVTVFSGLSKSELEEVCGLEKNIHYHEHLNMPKGISIIINEYED